MKEWFDERICFDLPDGIEVKRETNDEGKSSFCILCEPSVNEDGEKVGKRNVFKLISFEHQ